MASERFKVLIGDIPPPEPPKEYTKKEKAKTFWIYHKWYFYGGILAAVLVFSFIWSIVTKVEPDYQIGIITEQTVPDQLLRAVESSIVPLIDDRNGDGKTVVQINQYNLTFGKELSGDPNIHAANVTRLMGDIQVGDSFIFLVDNLQGVQENQAFLAYNDGTYPAEGEKVDYSKMGFKWGDCKGLSALELKNIEVSTYGGDIVVEDGQKLMKDFTMALRFYEPSGKENNKKDIYYQKSVELFNKLS